MYYFSLLPGESASPGVSSPEIGGEAGSSQNNKKWSTWSACSVTCDKGTQTRNMLCPNVELGGSGSCSDEETETRACQETDCRVDGGWGDWAVDSHSCKENITEVFYDIFCFFSYPLIREKLDITLHLG